LDEEILQERLLVDFWAQNSETWENGPETKTDTGTSTPDRRLAGLALYPFDGFGFDGI
jgi:hypothetical protein